MFDFIKNLFIKDTTLSENDILTGDDFINTDFSGSAFAEKYTPDWESGIGHTD